MELHPATARPWTPATMILRSFAVLLVFLLPLAVGCDLASTGVDDEDDEDPVQEEESLLDCDDPATIPSGSKIHCLANSSGRVVPATYDEPALLGSWASSSFCVTYRSDGTGHFRFPGGFGSGASNVSFDWGIILNVDGSRTPVQGGGWYLFHQGDVDAQVALLWYRPSGEGAPFPQWDLQQGSCSF